jgi:hypothetical protein
MSNKGPIKDAENDLSDNVPEMKYPSMWDVNNLDYSDKAKIRKEKVVMRDTKTGHIYGSRIVFQRATEGLIPELLALREAETNHITDEDSLPEIVIAELKSNIRKGAKDLEQKWANALELTHKAFEVADVERPTPDQQQRWHQYETLIAFAVKQLSDTRGSKGDWRMTAYDLRKN